MTLKKVSLFVLGCLTIFVLTASAGYKMIASATSNGGGIMTSATRQVYMTLGQTPAGMMVSANFQNKIGLWHIFQWDIGTLVDGSENLPIVDRFELQQNYPNPFNPTTTIGYSILKSGPVKMVLYDMLGRQVTTLVDRTLPAGRHQVVFDAGRLPSGVYYYHLQAEGFEQHRKMLLVK